MSLIYGRTPMTCRWSPRERLCLAAFWSVRRCPEVRHRAVSIEDRRRNHVADTPIRLRRRAGPPWPIETADGHARWRGVCLLHHRPL